MKMADVETVVDSERGCGWRKEGGLYLRCDGEWESCGKLPVPFSVCPCCGAGTKPARGWTWFDPRPFLAARTCAENPDKCALCPLGGAVPERAGLLWVGEKFYPTPADYMKEAVRLGVSRRIPRVPQGFKLGDRVFLAHRLAIDHKELCACRGTIGKNCGTCNGEGWVHNQTPGLFTSFVPSRIEYVCKGDETEEQLDALLKRDIVPVKVVRDVDIKQPELSGEATAKDTAGDVTPANVDGSGAESSNPGNRRGANMTTGLVFPPHNPDGPFPAPEGLTCDCGTFLDYPGPGRDYYCPHCHRDYNSAGQRLAPRCQWGEETGETAADYFDGVANPERALEDR